MRSFPLCTTFIFQADKPLLCKGLWSIIKVTANLFNGRAHLCGLNRSISTPAPNGPVDGHRSFIRRVAAGIRSPAQVLAAVKSDHLPGHRRRVKDETHRFADLVGHDPAPKRQE